MDGDPEKQQETPKFIQALIILLFFTACNSRKEETLTPTIIAEPKLKKGNTESILTTIGTGEKTIYLTFDDGPNRGTQNVLNILTAEKVPATFFIIGQQVTGSNWQKEVFNQLQNNALIDIENHSYTHAHNKFNKFYLNPTAVVNDFTKCADSLHLTNKIARTPGRNIWRTNNINSTDLKPSTNAADSVWQAGFHLIGWDIEWHFNNHLKLTDSKEFIKAKIDSFFAKNETKLPNHLVLLAHDQSFIDPIDSLSWHQFIHEIKEENRYKISIIKNYPTLQNNQLN
jgi:peptidoglycan-N-acetylglucosamine deacetylase